MTPNVWHRNVRWIVRVCNVNNGYGFVQKLPVRYIIRRDDIVRMSETSNEYVHGTTLSSIPNTAKYVVCHSYTTMDYY